MNTKVHMIPAHRLLSWGATLLGNNLLIVYSHQRVYQ